MKMQSSKPRKSLIIVIGGIVAISSLVAGVYPAYASNAQSTDSSKSNYAQFKRGLSAKDWKLMVKGN
ncbi:MAG: hypothetical protein C4516_01305 [Oxalobacter sp.]|nr:MAG: hypothetical protein C4516_01305 [Oxalobacter sp.]